MTETKTVPRQIAKLMTRRLATAVLALTAYTGTAAALDQPTPIEAIYDGCLGRPPESPAVVDYWERHPDPSTAVCTSPESVERNAARGLVHFSSSTWLPAVMVDVRRCESGHDYQEENPRSTASGAWQFLDGTWTYITGLAPPASAYSQEVQDRAAAELLAIVGGNPGHTMGWAASRACWS